MPARRSAYAVLGFAATAMSGCSDTTAPVSQLTFCSPPSWVAVKAEGSPTWRSLDVTGSAVTFAATPRLSIAYSFSARDAYIWSITADELREMHFGPWYTLMPGGCSREGTIVKTLAGNVTGLPAGRSYDVTSTVMFATRSGASFTLGAPAGPVDLLARMFDSTSAPRAERVILRRDVDLPSGATIPTFDFASAESRPLDSASLVVTNFAGPAPAFFSRFFQTGFRTRSPGGMLRTTVDTALPFLHAVPESLLRPDDYHELLVSDCLPTCRRLSYYYRSARPTSLAFGPMAAGVTPSILSTESCVRVRIEMPAQPDYSSFAHVELFWGSRGNVGALTLGVTKGYLGATPSTWTVDVPEVRRPDGSCLLNASGNIAQISATVGDGRFAILAGSARPRAGELLRVATRGSSVSVP